MIKHKYIIIIIFYFFCISNQALNLIPMKCLIAHRINFNTSYNAAFIPPVFYAILLCPSQVILYLRPEFSLV